MIDTCTVILRDRSYALAGHAAAAIRAASASGRDDVLVDVACDCGTHHPNQVRLRLDDIVDIVDHRTTSR